MRPLLAVALVAGTTALAGCESHPQSTTVSTQETTRTAPPATVSTTTTTTRQLQ
jgi:type IV pilus biogenesis protein CpaD/CtpE